MRPTSEDKVSQLTHRVKGPEASCLKPNISRLAPYTLLPCQSKPDVLGFLKARANPTSRASVDYEIIELCLIPKMNSMD